MYVSLAICHISMISTLNKKYHSFNTVLSFVPLVFMEIKVFLSI